MSEDRNCECGKPLHHKGRCPGPLKRAVEKESKVFESVLPKKPIANRQLQGPFDDILLRLHEQKVKIEQAIKALQELSR